MCTWSLFSLFFFFNDTATTEIYTSVNTLSLHDALPIFHHRRRHWRPHHGLRRGAERSEEHTSELQSLTDISYAVFCLKKKKKTSLLRVVADERMRHGVEPTVGQH